MLMQIQKLFGVWDGRYEEAEMGLNPTLPRTS
jgi:hypothetical protein